MLDEITCSIKRVLPGEWREWVVAVPARGKGISIISAPGCNNEDFTRCSVEALASNGIITTTEGLQYLDALGLTSAQLSAMQSIGR